MQSTSGKTILIGALRAISSARWRRRTRRVTLRPEHTTQARAQLFRLDDGVDEGGHLLQVGAFRHLFQRLAPRPAHAHLS
jgi:hypothetical protein